MNKIFDHHTTIKIQNVNCIIIHYILSIQLDICYIMLKAVVRKYNSMDIYFFMFNKKLIDFIEYSPQKKKNEQETAKNYKIVFKRFRKINVKKIL